MDRTVIRSIVDDLNTGGIDIVPQSIQRLHDAGAIKGIHVGNNSIQGEEILEWYAGQILEILENGDLWAVNSIINCLDKFCPLEIPTHG